MKLWSGSLGVINGHITKTGEPILGLTRFREWLLPNSFPNRDGRIRTGDPLTPSQVRYRAAPRPEDYMLSGWDKLLEVPLRWYGSRARGARSGTRPAYLLLSSRIALNSVPSFQFGHTSESITAAPIS